MALPAFSEDDATEEVRLPADAHRFTVEDYLRLAATGDPTWEHTELIDGVVYDVTPQYDIHGAAVWHIAQGAQRAFPAAKIRIGVSVRLGAATVVEPDVLVFRGDAPYDTAAPLPADLLLLAVEVSVSTLVRDRGLKARAYGAAGVPVYWVVDPTGDEPCLLVHTEPWAEGYNRVRRIALSDGVEALDVADALTA